MGSLILKTKPIRVSFNMLCCAFFFAPFGVLPRETISGFFGRKASSSDARFWKAGALFIDALHMNEADHCYETFRCETLAREALYACLPS